MSTTPYVFYNYSIIAQNEEVPFVSHYSKFKSLKNIPVAYRKSEPSEADKDTQLVGLKDRNINKKQVISFHITRRITQRKIKVYDDVEDAFKDAFEATSDYASSLVVVLPYLGKMVIADKKGEHDIDSNSAIGRLKRITKELDNHDLLHEYAATEEEIRRALEFWSIEEFNHCGSIPRRLRRYNSPLSPLWERGRG